MGTDREAPTQRSGDLEPPGTDPVGIRRIKVLIVDDHDIVALGLESLISDEPDIHVVSRAVSVQAGVEAASKSQVDVVLMDYRLPDGTGADAAKTIRALDTPPAILMLTSLVDRRVLSLALDAGCCGFVSKNADRSDLIEAIRAAASGDSYFTRDMLKHLIHLRRFDQVDHAELTDREIEVLKATAQGQSPDEIAIALYLSPHTIKNHLRHAMAKLDAHTKLDAVVKAIRARLISVDD